MSNACSACRRAKRLLAHLVTVSAWEQVLNPRTKHGANRLADATQHGLPAAAIRNDETDRADEALADFKANDGRILVATIAARGLDIDGATPWSTTGAQRREDYVHRIGRTGRARAWRQGDLASIAPDEEKTHSRPSRR
ncbi:helicase-related protein [Pseudomonas aeruginosa]|nr:helicase-related protein [Pseudomonas aeruginosa]